MAIIINVLLLLIFGRYLTSAVNNNDELNSCEYKIEVKQILYNEGYHRNLTYKLKFEATGDNKTWMFDKCFIAVDQELPTGVFVNLDELEDLKRSRKANIFSREKIVSVEDTAERSPQIGVFVYGKILRPEVHLWMPVHARYYQARARGGHVKTAFAQPRIIIQCKTLSHCDKYLEMASLCSHTTRSVCKWREPKHTMLTDTVYWHVPVGNTDHFYVVAFGTVLMITVASIYLFVTIIGYKKRNKKTN